jgi:hypothetical protein
MDVSVDSGVPLHSCGPPHRHFVNASRLQPDNLRMTKSRAVSNSCLSVLVLFHRAEIVLGMLIVVFCFDLISVACFVISPRKIPLIVEVGTSITAYLRRRGARACCGFGLGCIHSASGPLGGHSIAICARGFHPTAIILSGLVDLLGYNPAHFFTGESRTLRLPREFWQDGIQIDGFMRTWIDHTTFHFDIVLHIYSVGCRSKAAQRHIEIRRMQADDG